MKEIFLDNNGTTLMCEPAIRECIKWFKCYNPSSDSRLSKPVKDMIEKSKRTLLAHCHTNCNKYSVIFTSGASESNSFILESCINAYKIQKKKTPHIIISAIEHSSIYDGCETMERDGIIELDKIYPNVYGAIQAEAIEKFIKPNTCLISIMYANNETGTINNIPKIGRVCHKHSIPFHSDCVQIFGKVRLNIEKENMDALSLSFHKFYGPKGLGALIIKKSLIEGYKLQPIIYGHQQYGLRGGTENVSAIPAAMAALKWTFIKRKEKNKKLLKMRNYILSELGKHYSWGDYRDYITGDMEHPKLELILLGMPPEKKNLYLPNTILMSVAKNSGSQFCNIKFKHALDKHNIIIGIGSSCLTGSAKASHVLDALRAPPVIKRGTIRISLGDYNTMEEIKKFIAVFCRVLGSMSKKKIN